MVPVDGTRDQPPGKTAQNWSRKDNIRAGAVSGPWRSAPRAKGAGAESAPPAPAAAPAAATPVSSHAELTPVRPARGSQLRGMAIWVGLGALVAIAIVVAAVLLRPGQTEPEPASTEASTPVTGTPAASPSPPAATSAAGTPGPVEAASAPKAEGAAPPDPDRRVADPALVPVRIVRLRIGPEVDDARRDSLVADLKDAGVPEVIVEPLPFRIATSRIGYYRDADLPAAQALARVISPGLGAGAPIGVRDYGELLTDPEPGRLDLWVGG